MFIASLQFDFLVSFPIKNVFSRIATKSSIFCSFCTWLSVGRCCRHLEYNLYVEVLLIFSVSRIC